jgi:hypothetical protein
MPIVNIYFKKQEDFAKFQKGTGNLKKYLSGKLSNSSITLSPEEISVRLINALDPTGMIANVEIEITAHRFPERVGKQDEICLEIMKHLQEKTGISDLKVWLLLVELGHSW